MSAPTEHEEGTPIAAVEQATGIARATLRIWERRYGFPQPGRDLRGERSYPGEQVRKLRLIADLMAHGHRPGGLVGLNLAQLATLAGPAAARAARRGVASDADPVLAALRANDAAGLDGLLQRRLGELGPVRFVTECVAPLNVAVGEAWARGQVEVYQEHLYTERVQQVLRTLAVPRDGAAPGPRPRVLLATFPEEAHGLGLLMAQVLLATEGCACTSLGVRVPLPQIVAAAASFHADVVGVTCTGSMRATHVLRGLEQLRGELPPRVAIWAGGASPALERQRIAGVQPVPEVREVPALVARWTQEQGVPARG
jgi:methanogenic corrinoid protein MtbC1